MPTSATGLNLTQLDASLVPEGSNIPERLRATNSGLITLTNPLGNLENVLMESTQTSAPAAAPPLSYTPPGTLPTWRFLTWRSEFTLKGILVATQSEPHPFPYLAWESSSLGTRFCYEITTILKDL